MAQKKTKVAKKVIGKRGKPKEWKFAPPRLSLKAFSETDIQPPSEHHASMIEKHDATDQNYIRSWRLYRGLKMQKDLAELTKSVDPYGVGLDRVTICRLETGQMQYNETHLKLISHALRVAPRDLIGTDPFNSGDIFKLYADTPLPLRRKLTLSPKR